MAIINYSINSCNYLLKYKMLRLLQLLKDTKDKNNTFTDCFFAVSSDNLLTNLLSIIA